MNREQFEAAYRKAYPITCELVPDVFAVEYGEYTRTPVQVGWVMWQAGAAAENERLARKAENMTDGWHSLTPEEIRDRGIT